MQIKDKQQQRKKYRDIRKQLPFLQRQKAAVAIKSTLFSLPVVSHCRQFLCYLSFQSEVPTDEIILKAFEKQKKVCVPYCIENTNQMDFYQITSLCQVEKRSFGIREPIVQQCKKITKFEETAVCVIPGVAFDTVGNRLGQGKGFYDRFLTDFQGIKIGITYQATLAAAIAKDVHDVKMDYIITENNLYVIRK